MLWAEVFSEDSFIFITLYISTLGFGSDKISMGFTKLVTLSLLGGDIVRGEIIVSFFRGDSGFIVSF